MADELSEEQIEEFRDVFNIFDKKRTGLISMKDFGAAMRTMCHSNADTAIDGMVTEVDLHGTGEITFDEFLVVIVRKIKESETKEEILTLFKAFDADGNGTISTEELRSVIHYLIDKVDEDEVLGIIKQIDRDGTGEIDYQDFVKRLTTRN